MTAIAAREKKKIQINVLLSELNEFGEKKQSIVFSELHDTSKKYKI